MAKKGAGMIFGVISALLAAASVIAYLYNCRTPYFATIGVSSFVVGCIVAGAVIQLLAVALAWKGALTTE